MSKNQNDKLTVRGRYAKRVLVRNSPLCEIFVVSE